MPIRKIWTGHYPGWYVRYRRGGKEVVRYAGPTRETAEAYLGQKITERASDGIAHRLGEGGQHALELFDHRSGEGED